MDELAMKIISTNFLISEGYKYEVYLFEKIDRIWE